MVGFTIHRRAGGCLGKNGWDGRPPGTPSALAAIQSRHVYRRHDPDVTFPLTP